MVSQWHYSLHTKYIFSSNAIYRYTSRRGAFQIYLYIFIFFIYIVAQINNCARLGRKILIWLKKIKHYNTYVKLDIEWNISDFICKKKTIILPKTCLSHDKKNSPYKLYIFGDGRPIVAQKSCHFRFLLFLLNKRNVLEKSTVY